MLKNYPYISFLHIAIFIIALLFCACAKKAEIKAQKDIKEQIITQDLSVTFPKNRQESKEWYEKYFVPILKDSKYSVSKNEAREYEEFVRLFFADLSQIEYENEAIKKENLAQSVIFTNFSQEFFREYLFIKSLGVKIAPWNDFSSKINFKENIQSSSFVLNIMESMGESRDVDSIESSDSLRTLQNKTYLNFNHAVLGNSLLKISDMYYQSNAVLKKSSEISNLKEYNMPQDLQSLLYYRILYFKYNEKFLSNYLLDRFAFKYPQSMINALNSILQRKFGNASELQTQFRFQNYEPTNPVSIAQCKGADDTYPYKSECVGDIFVPWVAYLRSEVSEGEVLPIFVDSKLCVLINRNDSILYAQNTSALCGMVYRALTEM